MLDQQCGNGDRRRRIAPTGLQDEGNRSGHDAGLPTGKMLESFARDDDRILKQIRIGYPLQRLLKGRERPDQRLKLLRHRIARNRPEPRAAAAGQKNGHYFFSYHRFS